MQAIIGPGATGSFAGLDGTTVTIEDLSRTTEPVGVPFTPQLFITFDAAPTLPALEINQIFPGIYDSSQCLSAPAVGQTCTPNPPVTSSTSPFNFVNNPPGPGEATASFVFAGDVAGTTSTWNGNFTSQFSVPFQSVLSQFATVGFVTNTYSATFDVEGATVRGVTPETSSLSLLALGLGLMVVGRSTGLIARVRRRR
jgi:hypothetical protein